MAWTKEDNGQEIHDECQQVEAWIDEVAKEYAEECTHPEVFGAKVNYCTHCKKYLD